MISISIEHNFETAHRLPFLPGKCENLHGHSWKTIIDIEQAMDTNGLTVEYGTVKGIIRAWIDTRLDHGVMLGVGDPLVEYFTENEPSQKMYVFGVDYSALPWPTVEAVAQMLADRLQRRLSMVNLVGTKIVGVQVQETAVNSAYWMDTS